MTVLKESKLAAVRNIAKTVASFIVRYKWQAGATVFVVAFALFMVGYIDAKKQVAVLGDSQLASQQETDQLVADIGAHFLLPTEAPTVVTITNATNLKQKDFFKDAHDGDKVLIFSESGRALLYRPSDHKVIEYSQVVLNPAAN